MAQPTKKGEPISILIVEASCSTSLRILSSRMGTHILLVEDDLNTLELYRDV